MDADVKLSIVILCWNDQKVIMDCLQSIIAGTHEVSYEILVSDNGSSDGTPELIRNRYPQVRILENKANLGFAKGNNVGIRAATGEYILILNPDTIVHQGSLDKWIAFADRHARAGAFGCRVLNPDGSYQISARPLPTVRGSWISALYLRPLGRMSTFFVSDTYAGWEGDSEREVDWQSGCCVMFRGELLKSIGGFDEQFFYQCEEVDLCRRVWLAERSIVFTPDVTITHLGGQSVNRFPVRFELEKCRNAYRFFYKHYGERGARQYRLAVLVRLQVRRVGYRVLGLFQPGDAIAKRLQMYKVCFEWNKRIDPVRFVERGEEPVEIAQAAV